MAPKKKLTKKEKARIEAEQAEILRQEMEKEKLRKFEEERERKLREREEAEIRQKQEIAENKIRRAQLKLSMEYFDNVQRKIDLIKIEERNRIEWNQYMRCNGLPFGHDPTDVRKYIHIWQRDVIKRQENDFNWLMQTDERTLLSQDPDLIDLTQKTLKKQQENLGDVYSNKIQEILGVMDEMNDSLKLGKLNENELNDLIQLKMDIRKMLRDYLDDYTSQILIQIDRDMEIVKPGIFGHSYQSNIFKSQIIAIQDITVTREIKIRSDEPQLNEIEFPLLEVQLQLPPTVPIRFSAFRGMWLTYDHYSDSCNSFHIPKTRELTLNLLQQTKKEWKKRKEILAAALEATTRIIPVDAANFDVSTTEQPDQSTVIDVDKVYCEYEDELNKIKRRAIGVEVLKLSEYEVNLRKYRIVGGIFAIDHLEQPEQMKRLSSKMYIRTVVSPDKLVQKKFHESYKPPPPPLPGVRRLPEEIEAEMRMIEKSLDKLALVTIQLPSTVLWLEPPITCRWETPEEYQESEEMISATVPPSSASTLTSADNTTVGTIPQDNKSSSGSKSKQVNDNKPPSATTSQQSIAAAQPGSLQKSNSISTTLPVTQIERKKSSRVEIQAASRKQSKKSIASGTLNDLSVHEITDFDLCNIPRTVDLYNLTVTFLAPRLPDGYCFKTEPSEIRAPKNSLLALARYEVNEDQAELKKIEKKAKMQAELSRSIKDTLIETNSPRPLFPNVEFKNILKIKPINNDQEIKTNEMEENINGENTSVVATNSYMFSQFLEEFDEICNENIPYFPLKLDEDDSNQSTPMNSLPTTPPRKFSSFYVMRGNDAEEKQIKIANTENVNSSSSSECNEDDDEEENEENDGNQDDKNPLGKQKGQWSTRDVHDTKFNEDKFSMQFRTGRFGYFGFAINRYSNMPYQTWEIKPDLKNPGVINFSLTAAVISIEISITVDGFCVNAFQGGTVDVINDMIGKTMQLESMKEILQNCGVDIFPEADAFCYTEGSCEKNYVMETHLYKCMASLALSHNFTWSRWNLLSGSRVVVVLMRELLDPNKKPPTHSTLYVTPLKAAIIDCTELSASFTNVPIQGMEYYADLHQLIAVHGHAISKERQTRLDPVLRENVSSILISTRPLSFC